MNSFFATALTNPIGLDTQDPLQVVVVLVAGILLQVYGARLLVGGATGIGRRFGISDLVMGSTVVAFGVSGPELFVSLWAAGKGQGDIAVGNAVGGVTADICLILGLSALTRPLRFRPQLFQAEAPILVAAAALVAYLLRNSWVGRFEASLLVFALAVYAVFVWFSSQIEADSRVIYRMEQDLPPAGPSKWVDLIQLIGGIVLLFAGSRYLVKSAVTGAEMLGISQAGLALAVIPLATSAPELFAVGSALMRGEKNLPGGIVIGGCIFNCLGVLGLAGLFRPLLAPNVNQLDLAVMLLATFMVIPLLHADQKKRKAIGVALLVGYGLYLSHLLGRSFPTRL
jgi:cation:H+ antiporter